MAFSKRPLLAVAKQALRFALAHAFTGRYCYVMFSVPFLAVANCCGQCSFILDWVWNAYHDAYACVHAVASAFPQRPGVGAVPTEANVLRPAASPTVSWRRGVSSRTGSSVSSLNESQQGLSTAISIDSVAVQFCCEPGG
eukprot:1161579-Pelagomonas_calceolata.AAC.3